MGTYTGAEQAMIDLWIKTRLLDPTVQAALDSISTGLGAKVFPDFAPKDATWPVIIFQCQDPPRDVRGVGTSSVMVDTLYIVKVVAQADSYDDLADPARVLHGALTTSTGDAVGDGLVLTSIRENQYSMTEVDEGVQFRHLGGIYRIQATAQ